MSGPRAEAPRDQVENVFTWILRRVYEAVPAVLAAVLVDAEGECIDFVSAIDPFDAKVSAAHMHMLLQHLCATRLRPSSGQTHSLEIVTSEREVWVRRLGGEYVLIALLRHGFDRDELRDAMACAGREFRAEIGLEAPGWEGRERLSVRLRTALGWQYAPEGFSLGGERVTITDVIGRWIERPSHGGAALVCFRVRTQRGQEVTLSHDEHTEVWQLRD
jgi:hypothetical protein